MEKHIEGWKRAIVNGKVHTEKEISVIRHEAVGGPGFNPTTNEETLLWQKESEEPHKAGNRGGHRGVKDLEAQEHTSISHNENNCHV